jgi:hypothetical protein
MTTRLLNMPYLMFLNILIGFLRDDTVSNGVVSARGDLGLLYKPEKAKRQIEVVPFDQHTSLICSADVTRNQWRMYHVTLQVARINLVYLLFLGIEIQGLTRQPSI